MAFSFAKPSGQSAFGAGLGSVQPGQAPSQVQAQTGPDLEEIQAEVSPCLGSPSLVTLLILPTVRALDSSLYVVNESSASYRRHGRPTLSPPPHPRC